ncbi:UDP-2,4-diacetamido-2,4,6-trideoxy-beta-L-altropyranose hydrolase [Chloroflexota bacterium]
MADLIEGLIIRADAGTEIGTGHLMRCLALAQEWTAIGGSVDFITTCQNSDLLRRLQDDGFNVHVSNHSHPDPADWDYTKKLLAAQPDCWVVLDGYHFDEVYQQQVKEAEHRLLVVDDIASLAHYCADIVINQNLHAGQLRYVVEPYTELLLGTRYVLLRREFLAWRGSPRKIPKVAQRVLVTLGGTDPENQTLKVIQALQKVDIPGLEATVVVGASNPHTDVLEAAINRGAVPIRLVHNAENMPELMSRVDMAVSSAGITTWELLFFGIPSLFLALTDDQRFVAEEVGNQKAGENLGWAADVSVESLTASIARVAKDNKLRAEITANTRKMVDGQGVHRITTIMRETKINKLKLRLATPDDCRLLWKWANDPNTRTASFASGFIPWEEHVDWFQQKLADPCCILYIVVGEKNIPLGQVRFDRDTGESAEVSISITNVESNKGYGSAALKLACQRIVRESGVRKLTARIKKWNEASIRAFTRAGFTNAGLQDYKGQKVVEMTWSPKEAS